MSITEISPLRDGTLSEVWGTHRQWSVKTFGEERGPTGSLKHLQLEIEEVLENLGDTHEYVDCFFLLIDSISRAGITQDAFIKACNEKQDILYTRTYNKVPEGEASLHVK